MKTMVHNKLKLTALIITLFCVLIANAYAERKSIASEIDAVILERSAGVVDQDRFGLVLFYKFSCIHCKKFNTTFHRYIEQNPTPVLAYTLDGQSFPSLPNSVTPTNEELHQFFPNGNPVVPTVFLVDSKTHHIFPALRGEASIEQFSQRIHQLESGILQGADTPSSITIGNLGFVQQKITQRINDFHEQDFSYEKD